MLDENSPFTLEGSGLTYAIAKNRAERLVKAAAAPDFEVVVVNPAETYGPNDRDWITAGPRGRKTAGRVMLLGSGRRHGFAPSRWVCRGANG